MDQRAYSERTAARRCQEKFGMTCYGNRKLGLRRCQKCSRRGMDERFRGRMQRKIDS
jgi:hypothetical protein